MRLSPRELEGLLIHQTGFLAQKRLARCLKLNHPEAVALIACQVRHHATGMNKNHESRRKANILLCLDVLYSGSSIPFCKFQSRKIEVLFTRARIC